MGWEVEKKPQGGRTDWKIPESEVSIHEETGAVEDLNILPGDLSLLPEVIQSGASNWQKQSITIREDEWTDDFYPQFFKWSLDSFYPKNYLNVWTEQEFYPKNFTWITQDFYPKNFKHVWTNIPTFYPVQGGWVGDGFYPKNYLNVWKFDSFYPKNFENVWTNKSEFYPVQGGWYITDDVGEEIVANRRTFIPIGS